MGEPVGPNGQGTGGKESLGVAKLPASPGADCRSGNGDQEQRQAGNAQLGEDLELHAMSVTDTLGAVLATLEQEAVVVAASAYPQHRLLL